MVPQFYLLTPVIDDPMGFRPQLDAAIATGAFAVILLRLAVANETDLKRYATALRNPVQEAQIACLITCPEDPRLVSRLGLDGTHVAAPGPLVIEAIETLKPERIIGVGGLRSRHDAMELGEQDLDYVMFGEPRPDGFIPPLDQTVERAEWWASIFNVPCVAYAQDMESIAPLAATGAEFIAIGPWIFAAKDPSAEIAEARRIAKAHAKPDRV